MHVNMRMSRLSGRAPTPILRGTVQGAYSSTQQLVDVTVRASSPWRGEPGVGGQAVWLVNTT
jgi:hypothetical protein